MSTTALGILFVAIAFAALIGFPILDRWHQRYAWRRANQMAVQDMIRLYGDKPGFRAWLEKRMAEDELRALRRRKARS